MSDSTRVPARRDEMTGAWFDGLLSGRLLLRVCPQGHSSRPDVLACDVCSSPDLDWAASEGRGSVVARAVDHSTNPPTCLAVVELTEGPWLITRAEGSDVARGDVVVVHVVQPDRGEPYPVVVPAAALSALRSDPPGLLTARTVCASVTNGTPSQTRARPDGRRTR
ncbi:MAG: hypothetical protein QOH68_2521 [Nocardioidaceae bacterium]|nr:hypothetical protein [Nocardioidaceae bacterium]